MREDFSKVKVGETLVLMHGSGASVSAVECVTVVKRHKRYFEVETRSKQKQAWTYAGYERPQQAWSRWSLHRIDAKGLELLARADLDRLLRLATTYQTALSLEQVQKLIQELRALKVVLK